MFLLQSDFRNYILLLIITSILLGTLLVLAGGYLTDNYFMNMVSGIIGEYGEYDLLFILSTEKEDIALEQIKKIINETLPGSTLKSGPKVAGSSNYLLKLPDKYKNEEVYLRLGRYFSDIPGLMSKNVMTEPRLSIRGFRGNTRNVLRSEIEAIDGIDFLYRTGDGLDLILEKPELIPEVKKEINKVLNRYSLLEIRYPLDQHPGDLPQLREEIKNVIADDVEEVIDVTRNVDTDRISLLTSLKQMKTFLLSYATKIVVSLENTEGIKPEPGSRLLARTDDGQEIILEVIEKDEDEVTALIQEGKLAKSIKTVGVYRLYSNKETGEWLGTGKVNNPRQELSLALERLNEITPNLNEFLRQSQQLIDFSQRLSTDLKDVNQGLTQLGETSKKLNESLQEWQQEGLSSFLHELLVVMDGLEANIGDINDIKVELVKTSNKLKEGAGIIEERLVYIPRNNTLYQDLYNLKEVFLRLAFNLDQNYDLVSSRLKNTDSLVGSIDEWRDKINSLLKVENTLGAGTDWHQVGLIINEINQSVKALDTTELQGKLESIQNLLIELKTTQLPVVLSQLSYIQNSLPDLKEDEIVDTINLIDRYIAGQVIPGDQIQLLLQGNYNNKEISNQVKKIIKNPAVSIIPGMEAGSIVPNPRGELFNILSQVRAVISTIIAFIFTLLVMLLDQTLIISVLRLKNSRGYLYSLFTGGLIFSAICRLSQINFPYLNFELEFIIGGLTGLIIGLFAGMLNPVNQEEWEAGTALGFSPADIMHEIIIPSGKPGILYLLNYPRVIFK